MNLQGQSSLSDDEINKECIELCLKLEDLTQSMTFSERQFVNESLERISDFGPRTRFSLKQLFWLRDLNTKY